jgi:hypothetical protein
VQRSETCLRYAQQRMIMMVLIIPVKFHWNPASSLISERRTRFKSGSHFVQRSWTMPPICTTRNDIDRYHFCEVQLKSFYQSDLWKLDRIILFIWWPICAAKRNVPVICTTRDGTDYSCEVISKFQQQFDLWRPYTIFLFITLVVILCSEVKRATEMHN